MSRYIDADKLKSEFDYKHIDMNKTAACVHHKNILEIINQQPTANVRENVPGKWWHEPHTNNTWVQRCSNCFHVAMITVEEECPYNYCPLCGADMRGEHDERIIYTRDNSRNV